MERGERGIHRCGKALLDIKEWSWNLLGISSFYLPALLYITSCFFPFFLPTPWSWAKFHRSKDQSSILPSDTSHKLQDPLFSSAGYKFRDSHYSLRFNDLNSDKCCSCYSFITVLLAKRYKSEPSNPIFSIQRFYWGFVIEALIN